MYSGNVTPEINCLDYAKLKRKLTARAVFTDNEMKTIEELLKVKKAHEQKQIVQAIWDGHDLGGSRPHCREGAGGCMIGNTLYIFGGCSQSLFNDLRQLDFSQRRWDFVEYAKDNT